MDYKNLKASDGTGNAVLAHITADRAIGATVIEVDNTDNWPNEFIVVTGTVNANGYIDADDITEMKGHLSGGDIVIDSFEPGHTDEGNTDEQIAIIKPTTGWANDMVELARVAHKDNGELEDESVTPNTLSPATKLGWLDLGAVPSSVTLGGNRSITAVFPGDLRAIIDEGQKHRFTRSAPAPSQALSLNGTSQYMQKTTPNKMAWTDDFAAGRWIFISSAVGYQAMTIESRFNGTSGWAFGIDLNGRVQMIGYNASGSNFSEVKSMQSVPMDKWVFVSAQLDMSAFTATTTTSYTMIDLVDVPSVVSRGGTNPTALVQAGNYQVGALNGSNFFGGKIGPGGVFNSKVLQATWAGYAGQALTGAETNLASGQNFNGSALDVNTTTPNDLSAVASAGYTADSPFGGGSRSYDTAGTVEYGVVSKKPTYAGSDTTVVYQLPEGHTLPAAASISDVEYTRDDKPFGFPGDKSRWCVETKIRVDGISSTPTSNVWYQPQKASLAVPPGKWDLGYRVAARAHATGSNFVSQRVTLSTTISSETDRWFTTLSSKDDASSGLIVAGAPHVANEDVDLAAQTTFNLLHLVTPQATMGNSNGYYSGIAPLIIRAYPNFL